MATTVIHHLGRKGQRGADASDGIGVDSVRYSKVKNSLAAPLRPNTNDPLLESGRDGYATFVNASGQVDENPGDTVKYCLNYSNDFDNPVGWASFINGYTVVSDNVSDPDGGNRAFRIQYPDTTNEGAICMVSNVSTSPGKVYRFSLWVRLASGEVDTLEISTSFSTNNPLVISGVNSEWQRLSGIISIDSASTAFLFTPKGIGCTLDIFEMQLTEGANLYPIETTLDVIPLEIENQGGAARLSRDGYLLEQAKQNICKHSQAMNKWVLVGAPDVSYLSGDGIFDGSPCVFTFAGNNSIAIRRDDLATTSGETYTVSFYAKLISGEIESSTVSIGQASQSFTMTDSLQRFSYQLVAGQNSRINFAIVAERENPSFVITGVQVEVGSLSSYIPTSFTPNTRSFDRLNYMPDSLSRMDSPFTIAFGYRDFIQSAGSDFLFNVGGQFFATVTDGKLSLNNGALADLPSESGDIILTYDGATAKVYIDAVEVLSQNVNVTQVRPEYLYIGSSDGAGSNASNFTVKSLRWWDFVLTTDEMKLARSI